ncbi:MAG: hypothetical protein OEO77_12355 [Acidimicrobiia bacterium]|nr:hypothetical protein [Acidimicrobiia bacterium]
MHHMRNIGMLCAVAMLVLGLAAPVAAEKGPPSRGLDVTVEPASGVMWANSVGDQIEFDITVTNRTGGPVELTSVTFESFVLLQGHVALEKNKAWAGVYTYTVTSLDGVPIAEQTQVNVGTVTANAGTVSDSADAFMKAYAVPSCGQDSSGVEFTFGTNQDYAVCSFSGAEVWELTTTLNRTPRGKSSNPSATVRDGVPGNWCDTGDRAVVGMTVTDFVFLPADGVCLVGGAAGDTIPVRNHELFYLATWTGNIVSAAHCGLTLEDCLEP